MPKKRIIIPGNLIEQELWKNPKYARAWIELWIITSDRKISVDKSWFTKRWDFAGEELTEFFNFKYVKDKFSIKEIMGLIDVDRSNPNRKESDPEVKGDVEDFAKHYLQEFNKVFNTRYRNYNVFIRNLEYWLDIYEPNDIIDAIHASKRDDFWNDKMKPTIMFRRKSRNGENIDYIGDFLNSQRVGRAFQSSIGEGGN